MKKFKKYINNLKKMGVLPIILITPALILVYLIIIQVSASINNSTGLKNNQQKGTCFDSDFKEKPDDIYIKGKVIVTDSNGVKTILEDECSGSKNQVSEMWCYENPQGSENYVQGRMIYNCPKGCVDGACLK